MSLLGPDDQARLRESFDEMTANVRLLFFTQSIGCESCLPARQILDELPLLSDRVSIEEVNVVLEKDRAAQYGIDRVPAVALLQDDGEGQTKDSRIRFLGAASGYEFISLVQAVLLVGGRGSSLTDANRAKVMAVDRPMTMKVFSTPT